MGQLTDPEMARLYREDGLNIREIAEIGRCSWGDVSAALRRESVPSRPPGGQIRATLNEISAAKWHELYCRDGLSIEDLRYWVLKAHELPLPPAWKTVRSALVRAGITLRSSTQQIRIEFRDGRRKPTFGHKGHPHTAEAKEKIAEARKRRSKRI